AAALPYRADTIQRMLSKAAMKGAKRYAPVTYNQAKAGFLALKAYLNQKPVGSSKPENLVQIYGWAKQALSIASRVKIWRSDRGSHEMLVLQNQHSRQRLAEALQLNPDMDDSTDALVKVIHQWQAQLQQQTMDAKKHLQAVKQACKEDKQQALAQLQNKLLVEKNTQLRDMKDAFRAKLERETFEVKRQKRLRALFPEKDVQIIVNLDGSLLIRLGMLKFGSGETKLDAKYYDLLGRLKEAMDMYGDRTFRIEGHTDSLGDVKENQQLSLQRAESVRDFLIAAGVDATSIKALGYGEIRPIASNEYAKGREMNRRIDVVIEARGE
ncbi:MAG: OmpA family protein, partial [Mariprofundaceae bacterium]|nr:OmpA family protein [Mariprofundaceae bacterium]